MQKCILLALLLSLIHNVSSYTSVDEYFWNNKIDSQGWSLHNQDKSRSLVDSCGKQKLFGYFDQQTAIVRGIQLPPHNGAQLKVVLWTFNKWSKGEVIEIWMDQRLLASREQPASKGQCDGEAYSMDSLTFEFDHQDESAIIVIYALLNKNIQLASWGISNFQFSVNLCDSLLFCQQNTDQYWERQYQYWNSYEIQKLNAEGWSGSQISVQCGVPFVGGKYDLIETKKKTFALKPNFKSKIKFLFARFSNGANQKLKPIILTIKINGQKQIATQNLKLKFDQNEGYKQDLCLSDDFEYFYRYEFNLNSPNEKIDFEISSDEQKQAWGLRDFNIYIQPCSEGCTKCKGPLGSDCEACNEVYFDKTTSGCVAKSINSQLIVFSQSFTQDTFHDFDSWKPYSADKIYNCAPLTLFGVFYSYEFTTKYFDLPYHNGFKIKFDLYIFGQWDGEQIQIEKGMTKVYELKIKTEKNRDFIQCGNEKLWGKLIQLDTGISTFISYYDSEKSITIRSTLKKSVDIASWGFRNFEILYEPEYSCSLLFTQINYKGDYIELCESNIDFGLEKLPTQIKSILVPPQGKVTLFQNAEYNGKRYTFTQSTPIIEEKLVNLQQCDLVFAS